MIASQKTRKMCGLHSNLQETLLLRKKGGAGKLIASILIPLKFSF